MYPRTEYEMTADDLSKLMEAFKPVPYMVIGGHEPRSQQENANAAWAELGKRMGFDHMTVRSVGGKGNCFFSAVPSENETQRAERVAREREDAKQTEIARLKSEIEDRQSRLIELGQLRQARAPRRAEFSSAWRLKSCVGGPALDIAGAGFLAPLSKDKMNMVNRYNYFGCGPVIGIYATDQNGKDVSCEGTAFVLAADYDALAAELADWQRMRNEMRDVAFANKERAEKAEARVQALETALRDCWEDLTHCTPQGRRTWERAKALTTPEREAK